MLLVMPLLGGAAPAWAVEIPPYLPHYDLDIQIDNEQHVAHVRQRVTWMNYHDCAAKELVFNVHSNYVVPDDQIGFMAKTLEIMRMMPSESLITGTPAFQLEKVTLLELPPPGALKISKPEPPGEPKVRGQEPDEDPLPPPRRVPPTPQKPVDLSFHWQKDNNTALVVPLPQAIGLGDSVTVELCFTFKLPNKQGRWGYWKGVTFLTNWLPVLAFYDNKGWQPTPFCPWHLPWFNEAGIYHACVTLPCDQKVACSGSIVVEHDVGNGCKQVEIEVPAARDFALITSARFEEYCGEACGVKIKVLALPEHEYYARFMVKVVCEALPVFSQWFGPFPYPQFTIAESYFGWNGNQCGDLVMIDERVFAMPHMASNFVDYLVSHEFCHQWWYNIIGVNGYCETFMDEAPAVYFSHKLQDQKVGHNNPLLKFPAYLEWLPSIDRENYRYYSLFGTIGRGEACATVQDMPKFGHVVNLFSMCYDRGSKVLGLIESRLGEVAFHEFIRHIYCKYYFRILRVADLQCELEAWTGQSWQEFFQHWLYSGDMTDWCVEKVDIESADNSDGFLCRCLPCRWKPCSGPVKVTVLLHQKAQYNEATTLAFCMADDTGSQVRVPIVPQAKHLDLDEPPGSMDTLGDNRVRVEVVLPSKPKQITVDPDKLLVDPNPTNNTWKTQFRFRFAPCYTFLEETDLTNDYDKWNFLVGPWLYFPAYYDPWFTRSVMIGVRAGLYKTQSFTGGVYTGYRTDYRDVVIGGDALWDHLPWHHTQLGFIVEHRLTTLFGGDQHANRAVIFGRYVIDYGDSLYLPPMHYLEEFSQYQDNFLPFEKHELPGSLRYEHIESQGLHYHLDYLTPYWDPEGGFRIDTTASGGGTRLQRDEGTGLQHERGVFEFTADFSAVKGMPDGLGWFSDTRLAVHAYGAAATLKQGEFFPLGGESQFRGFDLPDRQGSFIWGGTLEWRVPLVHDVVWDVCDHVAGVRNVYLAAFTDVGDTYVNGHSYGPVAYALGGGLRADVAWFSFIERTILRVDIAKCVNTAAPVQVFFGMQHPF
jgi:hypothetical protein